MCVWVSPGKRTHACSRHQRWDRSSPSPGRSPTSFPSLDETPFLDGPRRGISQRDVCGAALQTATPVVLPLRGSLLFTGGGVPCLGCPTERVHSPVAGRAGRFPRGVLGSKAVSAHVHVCRDGCPHRSLAHPGHGRPGLQMLGTRVDTSGQTFRGAPSQGPSVGPPPSRPGPGAAGVQQSRRHLVPSVVGTPLGQARVGVASWCPSPPSSWLVMCRL